MMVGREDGLTGGNLAAAAFNSAAELKKLLFVPGGHFAAYTGERIDIGQIRCCVRHSGITNATASRPKARLIGVMCNPYWAGDHADAGHDSVA